MTRFLFVFNLTYFLESIALYTVIAKYATAVAIDAAYNPMKLTNDKQITKFITAANIEVLAISLVIFLAT